MKRFNIFSLMAGCFLLASCADESGRTGQPEVVDGIPVTATFTFQASGANKVTKASEAEENAVNDLYVLLFEEDGTFSTAQYFTYDELQAFGVPNVKIRTLSGTKKIYAAANVTGNSFTTGETHLKDRIDEFVRSGDNALDDWKKLTATINAEQVTWGEGRFLMTGFFSNNPGEGDGLMDSGESGSCVIDENGAVQTSGKIQLMRAVSRFTFNISAGDGIIFEPTSWQVVNAPKSVYLYKQPESGAPAGSLFFETSPQSVSNNKFDFYLLENRQETGAELPGDIAEGSYEEADWRENTENTPEDGTYIVLKGNFKGTADSPFDDNENKVNVEASVTYYIHLGYIDGAADYDVLRNYKYTYNVKVTGIDRIIVEADDGTETDRADGDAFFYGEDKMIDLDAHYARIELEFTPDDELTWAIQTAATGFGYQYQNEVTEGTADWILFIEKASNVHPNFTRPRSESGLMNIKELAEMLKAAKDNQTFTGSKTFYAYVEENYHEDLPLNEFINYDATTGEAKSRMMMISIERHENGGGSSSVSTAKYIIRQKPILTFYNMADQFVRGSKTFGMEWTNENLPSGYANSSYRDKAEKGGLLYGSPTATANSRMDGRANQIRELSGSASNRGSWTSNAIRMYGDMSQANAYAACMSRNRDENGDGNIDDDEIKWYLPAIDQYQSIWVGMEAIPNAATLYPPEFRNARQWQFYHYASSGKNTFWSEEGSATNLGLDNGWQTGSQGRFHIRCIRNLGPAGTEISNGDPIHIAEKTDAGTYIILKINGRLTAPSLRAGVSSTLTRHNEYGGSELGGNGSNNRLYSELWVQKTIIDATSNTWVGLMNLAYNNNPCARYGAGWRVPNQRELILITTAGGLTNTNDGNIFAGTYFSFTDIPNNAPLQQDPKGTNVENKRMGFSYASSNTNFNLGTLSNLRVRCVKDAM